MDFLDQELLQQLSARTISGEHLEVLGKKASADWGSGQYKSLTEAVVGTVKHAGLSPEQVRRVVEFANTDAFLKEFKKEGTPNKVIDFGAPGPADVREVMRDLNDGGGGSVFDPGTGDYSVPPNLSKTSSAHEEEALYDIFRPEGATEFPDANPYGDIVDLKDKLAAASSTFSSEVDTLEIMYAELADQLYGQVKQAAMGGLTLGEVLQAWQTVAPSAEHVKVAFQLITPRLVREGVFHSVEAIGQSLEKTGAARMVNDKHPLVTGFSEYCETLEKLASTRVARDDTKKAHDEVLGFLKQAGKGIATAIVGGAHEGAKKLMHAAGTGLEPLLGEGAAKVVKGSGKFIVPGVGLVGANELRRHLMYSPTVQSGLKYVPGTDAYQNKNMELQQRAQMARMGY